MLGLGQRIQRRDAALDHVLHGLVVIGLAGDRVVTIRDPVMREDVAGHKQQRSHCLRLQHLDFQPPSFRWRYEGSAHHENGAGGGSLQQLTPT